MMASDIEHIELVSLKIGLAETDKQLQDILMKFLAPILKKLQSTDSGVRTRVMSLLTHINKRLKARETVQLPVEQLIHQFNDKTMNSFVTNFSIVYLKTGFKRLEEQKKLELLPLLFISIKGKIKTQQNTLLRLIAENFSLISFDLASTKSWFEEFKLKENEMQLNILLEYFLEILLMPYSATLKDAISSSPNEVAISGLSKNSVRRLLGDKEEECWSLDVIEKIKISILSFIKMDFVGVNKTVVHLIIASSDTRFAVATNAEMQLRNSLGVIDWSNKDMTMQIYKVYLGFAANLTKKNIGPEEKVQPANVRMKMKLMQYLLRCPSATEMLPHNIQVVYDGLFALSNLKLKTLALQFMHYIFDVASIEQLKKVAPMLLNAAIKVVIEKGESDESNSNNSSSNSRIQGLAYTSFTKLATRMPQLFATKFDLLQQFIRSLEQEGSNDVKQSIVQATTSMIPAFSDLPSDQTDSFRPIVEKAMTNKDHYIRLVGVRYAAKIFKQDDVDARFMLLLSTSDPKEEVSSEASNFIKAAVKSGKLPPFEVVLNYVSIKAAERLHSRLAFSIGVQSLAFHPNAFKSIIVFVFNCLLNDCGVRDKGKDEEDLQVHSTLQLHFADVVSYFKKEMENNFDKASSLMNKLLRLMIDYSSLVSDWDVLNLLLVTTGATCNLVSIDQLFKNEKINSKAMSKLRCLEWAQSLAFHSREETSYLGAEFFSLLFSFDHPNPEKYVELFKKQELNLKSKVYEEQHGAILVLGYLIGDYLSWLLHCNGEKVSENQDETDRLVSGLVVQIGEILNTSHDQNLVAAACFAIGEISRKSPLPLPDGNIEDDSKFDGPKHERLASKLDFVLLLKSRLKGKSPHKVQHRAAVALGRLPVGGRAEQQRFAHTKLIIEALLDTSETKGTERQFVVGESLISCALGSLSPESLNKWTGKPVHKVPLLENHQKNEVKMDVDIDESTHPEELLEKILTEYVEHRLPSARQASCIWLTKIIQSTEFINLPFFSKHLMKIQNAFTMLIVEPDELTQDLASKGLCLVYELADQNQKENLVSDLLESFTGSTTSSNVRIMGDESRRFFQDAKQRKKSDKKFEGPALMVYKEMCLLASDLNHPELVYKFLYLQNHRVGSTGSRKANDDPTKSLLSNKKQNGVSYKSVVMSTREELKPLYKQIIPRLYRNTFDPQPNVRNAMTSIWNVICPEPTKIIAAHLVAIVTELRNSLTHMLWRNRQASCLALIDLFRIGINTQMGVSGGDESDDQKTVSFGGNPVVDNLADIWSIALRVQDDMKESVREAATKLCRALQKLTLKLVDPQQSNHASNGRVLTDVVNVLLEKGMLSRVKESRQVSMQTLVEISKVSGTLIKPCISKLVISLLETLSDIEPQEINYLRNRQDGATQDKLDWVRAEFIKSSPMMETAVRVIKFYDSEVLDELVPALSELTKSGVGVPTKAGCAYFTIQLVSIASNDLTPYVGKLLKVFVAGLRDSSLAIRKVNSSAVGNLCRVAKDASVSKIIEKFKEWYLMVDDNLSGHASASAIYAIARHSSDTFQRHLTEILPLAFYAMHGEVVKNTKSGGGSSDSHTVTKNDDQSFDMSPKEMFEAIWNEFTPGSQTAVRIYLDEIVTLSSTALNSHNWQLKAQAAKTMSSVATFHTSHDMQSKHLNRLIEALVEGLRGRYWAGKNYLLKALKDLVKHHGSNIQQETIEQVLKALLAEGKRGKNTIYRCEALECYGWAASSLKIDRIQPLWDVARKLIEPKKEGDESGSSSSDEESTKQDVKDYVYRKILPAIDEMWSSVALQRVKIKCGEEFLTAVVHLFMNGTYQIRIVCLTSINRYLESALEANEKSLGAFSFVHSIIFQVLLHSLGDMKYSLIRQKAAASVSLLCRLSKAGAPFSSSSEVEQLGEVIKQQIKACKDLSSTAENMDALEHMTTALGDLLKC